MIEFNIGDLITFTGSNKLGLVISHSVDDIYGETWYNILCIDRNKIESFTADWLTKVA